MTLLTRASDAKIEAVSAVYAPQLAGDLYAGEDLDPVAPCHIEADGLVYMSNATAADADANIDGWTMKGYSTGQPVTLFGPGVIAKYSDGGLTPGDTYYVGATDGRLDDAPTTGDPNGCARAKDESHIRIFRAH